MKSKLGGTRFLVNLTMTYRVIRHKQFAKQYFFTLSNEFSERLPNTVDRMFHRKKIEYIFKARLIL